MNQPPKHPPPSRLPPWLAAIWRDTFVLTHHREEAASIQHLQRHPAAVDRQLVVVMLVTALSLTAIHFFGQSSGAVQLGHALQTVGLVSAGQALVHALTESPHNRINQLAWWAGNCVFWYFVVPAVVVRGVLKQPLANFGWRLQGAFKGGALYLGMYFVMLSAVILVSQMQHFQATYPFYRLLPGEQPNAALWTWEFLYAAQFVALEFFFRGFFLHGAKHRFGYYAVFVMMVPYCMIHFQKPLLECLGSIAAGLVLGTLSLKTRSIVLGAAIHIAVAWTMDFVSLWRQGML